jgi:formate dehydrogenase maturation protein FdhE
MNKIDYHFILEFTYEYNDSYLDSNLFMNLKQVTLFLKKNKKLLKDENLFLKLIITSEKYTEYKEQAKQPIIIKEYKFSPNTQYFQKILEGIK